jgi:hypothetical protein
MQNYAKKIRDKIAGIINTVITVEPDFQNPEYPKDEEDSSRVYYKFKIEATDSEIQKILDKRYAEVAFEDWSASSSYSITPARMGYEDGGSPAETNIEEIDERNVNIDIQDAIKTLKEMGINVLDIKKISPFQFDFNIEIHHRCWSQGNPI